MKFLISLQILIHLCLFSFKSLAEDTDISSFSNKYRWQVSFGHLNQSMTTEEKDSSSGSLVSQKKLSGNNLAVYFEVVKNESQYYDWLTNIGYETLSVSDKDSATYCPSNSVENCYVDVNYLTVGLMPRLKLSYNNFQIWSGLSLNVKQPLSKKSSAILDNQIQTTSTFGLALGLDYFINSVLILPMEVQQQYFLNSDTVKTQQVLIKIGLGRLF